MLRAHARRGTNAGPIWSVTAREGLAPGSALVAYCGTDGDVAVCSLPPEARDRKAHVPVACARPPDTVAPCVAAPQAPGTGCLTVAMISDVDVRGLHFCQCSDV